MAAPGVHLRTSTSATDATVTASSSTPQPSVIKSPPTPIENSVTDIPGAFIPPDTPSRKRTLVVCFDGTGEEFNKANSNVVQLVSILKKDDPTKQVVYYQTGIGTYTLPGVIDPLMATVSKYLDLGLAINLGRHVMDGYKFLMDTYKEGDRICIFGFSRGAYTARCLAGMVHKIGLLPAANTQQVPFAYKMYTRDDDEGWEQSNAFKEAFCIDVDIEFVGVWDTVNSVGMIARHLPFTASNTIIKTFRHAVSLDERRAWFKANLWSHPEERKMLGLSDQRAKKQRELEEKARTDGEGGVAEAKLRSLELRYSAQRLKPTDVYEVWFSGHHCDIGGGSVPNGTRPNLAQIPLRWMIRECFKTDSGLVFSVSGLKSLGLDPASLVNPKLAKTPSSFYDSKKYKSNLEAFIHAPPEDTKSDVILDLREIENNVEAAVEAMESEQEIQLKDALSPKFDVFDTCCTGWWILEYMPCWPKYHNEPWWSCNCAQPRTMPTNYEQDGSKILHNVHRSVQMRMDARYEDGKPYNPKNLKPGWVQWVD